MYAYTHFLLYQYLVFKLHSVFDFWRIKFISSCFFFFFPFLLHRSWSVGITCHYSLSGIQTFFLILMLWLHPILWDHHSQLTCTSVVLQHWVSVTCVYHTCFQLLDFCSYFSFVFERLFPYVSGWLISCHPLGINWNVIASEWPST